MSYEEYTWLHYYEELYRRQKKINNELAMQLGEVTAKNADLNVALNRVVGSPFWRVLAPARKIYGKIRGNGSVEKHSENTADAAAIARTEMTYGAASNLPGCVANDQGSFYHARLEQYEDFYGQWIRKDAIEQQYAAYEGVSGMDRIREAAFCICEIESLVGGSNPVKQAGDASWILFVGSEGRLANGYARRLAECLDTCPEALIAYADEDYYYTLDNGKIRRIEPNFKPDWSPDTLDSFFYLGHICLIRTDLARELTWLGGDNPWANVYDFFLQAAEHVDKQADAKGVIHIPQVLFHNCVDKINVNKLSNSADCSSDDNDSYVQWKNFSDSLKEDLANGKGIIGASEEYIDIKRAALARRGLKAQFVQGQDPDMYQIMYMPHSRIGATGDLDADDFVAQQCALVSILILSKDHPEVLRTCISSILERTDYENIEIIVVDNGSSPENRAKYEDIIEKFNRSSEDNSDSDCNDGVIDKIRYIYEEMDFNFSRMCNIAASYANGEYYLFLNDDVEVVQKDWLKLMVGYASLEHVGAVGAKLLYANSDLIQHIGITNLAIGPSHKMVIYPDDQYYYYGKNMLACDMLGVTAACLLIQADKYRMVGGFNEDFAVAYNDVDFNLKLIEVGLVNIQCNGALLYHYESLTRGLDEGNDEKWDRLLHEKKNLYLIHPQFFEADPYYNINLIGNHSNYLSNYDFGYNIHLKNEIVRQISASNLAECTSDRYKISVDFAGVQTKHNLEEPEITEVRGWSFIPGEDNGAHAVRVIFKSLEDGTLYEADSDASPRDDLVSTFPNEQNIYLCGFVCKILKNDLPAGRYQVGIEPIRLKHDLTDENWAGCLGVDALRTQAESSNEVVYTDMWINV